jgi:hypothetical protein
MDDFTGTTGIIRPIFKRLTKDKRNIRSEKERSQIRISDNILCGR